MTNACTFSVIDRQLLIVDPTGRVRWHGMPLGWPVEDVAPLPDTARAVVLLDYMAAPTVPLENLVCVDCDGQVIWRARLPTTSSTEAYVSFELIFTEFPGVGTLPLAQSVNGEPLTSAETIEAGIDAGLLVAVDTGAVFIGTVSPAR